MGYRDVFLGKNKVAIWKDRKYIRTKYPRVLPLSENQVKVIEFLVKANPKNAYRIYKLSGISYSYVFNTLKELEKRRLIELKKEIDTEKGTRAKIFDLTLEGVLIVLKHRFYDLKTKQDFLRKITENYRTMIPLVFGKYEYFKKIGLEELYRIRLGKIVLGYTHTTFRKGTGYYPWLEQKEQITCFFYLFDFNRLYDSNIKNFDPKVWLNALRNDKDIKKYILEELQQDKKSLENHQRVITKTISFLENMEQVITDIMKFFFEK